MEILNEYQALQNVMDEAGKNNPGHLRNTAIQLLTQDIPNWQEETDAPPEKDPQDPDLEAQSSRAQQRISTLEDQLKEEQNKNEDMENQINELQTQVESLQTVYGTRTTPITTARRTNRSRKNSKLPSPGKKQS